jgi:hypothetical protein
MKEKEFYFEIERKQFGPVSLDVLRTKNLTPNSLVWYEGLDNWETIKSIPELSSELFETRTPPSLPYDQNISTKNDNRAKSKDLGYIQKKPLDLIRPSQKELRFFLIWTSLHLFALITSISEIRVFAKRAPETEKFWPFVKIFKYHDIPSSWPGTFKDRPEAYWEFKGIFYQYDWSEFLVYVIGLIFLFIILRLSNHKKSESNKAISSI